MSLEWHCDDLRQRLSQVLHGKYGPPKNLGRTCSQHAPAKLTSTSARIPKIGIPDSLCCTAWACTFRTVPGWCSTLILDQGSRRISHLEKSFSTISRSDRTIFNVRKSNNLLRAPFLSKNIHIRVLLQKQIVPSIRRSTRDIVQSRPLPVL
jgi:hypothetical protein